MYVHVAPHLATSSLATSTTLPLSNPIAWVIGIVVVGMAVGLLVCAWGLRSLERQTKKARAKAAEAASASGRGRSERGAPGANEQATA